MLAKILRSKDVALNSIWALILTSTLGACLASLPLPAASAQTVQEITIAAPDVIAIEVRDAPFQPGRVTLLPASYRADNGTWIKIGDEWGKIIGSERSHVRISDIPPAAFLEVARIDDATAYPPISGNKVTAVYRKSVPYDSGIYRAANGSTMTGSSFKHYIYLKLSRPLSEGVHTIRWPAQAMADTELNYSSSRTRAIAIRANQNGYRASDEGKVAYLAVWLPGAPSEGAVDFRKYGLSTFHIIDEGGSKFFSSAFTLRMSPSDPEPGNGLPTPLLEYPSASQPASVITRVNPGNTVSFSAPNHGYSQGQRIWLDGFAGANKNLNGFATIGTVSRDRFELSDSPSGNSAPGSAGPSAWSTHRANRAGTYVFEINFGSWKPTKEGTYRIQIPGLGVSDPFDVRDDIWLRAGRTAIGGLYNHRSGIELDGRFGFSRPASFRPGSTITVKRSKLPLSWSTNTGHGFISPHEGGKAPWVTNNPAPDEYWGGYMDAGDWDRLIGHVDVSLLLLDVFESAQEKTKAIILGIPKSREVLDPKLYADSDDLPDLVHEAVWGLDFFRRLQLEDGSIIGGIESSEHPTLGEPSFLEHLTVFAYAPDHISTYRYAGGAAKLAGVLERLDKKELAEIFRSSAMKAWLFAERVHANPEPYYRETKAIATASGAFNNAPWQAQAERLNKADAEHRTAAAAALFRLTGEPEFNAIFVSAWSTPQELYQHVADGAWEYIRAESSLANKSLQKRLKDSIVASARLVANAQKSVAYPSMKNPYAPIGWGQGLAPDYTQTQMFIRAHQLTGDRELLRTMQVASAHILGANQVGLSFTTGLGHRNVAHPLHEDHRAMGVKAPPGITSYGWGSQAQTAHEWIFGPDWSPLPISRAGENAHYRKIAPNRFTMPFYDYFIEHPLLVMQQEYTVHQTIVTTAGMWLYLHAAAETLASGRP